MRSDGRGSRSLNTVVSDADGFCLVTKVLNYIIWGLCMILLPSCVSEPALLPIPEQVHSLPEGHSLVIVLKGIQLELLGPDDLETLETRTVQARNLLLRGQLEDAEAVILATDES